MAEETAPLLVNTEHDAEFGEHHGTSPSAPSKLPALAKTFKAVNLVASAVALAVVIATKIVVEHVPAGSARWSAIYTVRAVIPWIITSLILSAINVAVNIHYIINIVVDVVLALNIIPSVFHIADSLPRSDWCTQYRYPPYPSPPEKLPIDEKCVESKKAVQALMISTAILAGVVGAIYFSLAIIRIIEILRSKFWKRLFAPNFRLSPGEITLSVSLRFSKPQGGSSAGVASEEENAAGTSRGPVYI